MEARERESTNDEKIEAFFPSGKFNLKLFKLFKFKDLLSFFLHFQSQHVFNLFSDKKQFSSSSCRIKKPQICGDALKKSMFCPFCKSFSLSTSAATDRYFWEKRYIRLATCTNLHLHGASQRPRTDRWSEFVSELRPLEISLYSCDFHMEKWIKNRNLCRWWK